MSRKPAIVFCHGIWADGSCFNKVIPALLADGHEVIAVQYGLDYVRRGRRGDQAHAGARRQARSLLVGHSYGGATITGGGRRRSRARPGLHRGRRPGCRRDRAEPARQISDRTSSTHVQVADGRAWMLPTGVQYFRRRPSRSKSRSWCGRRTTRRRPTCFSSRSSIAANRLEVPSRAGSLWPSRTTPCIPTLQRFLAKRMGATVDRGRQQSRRRCSRSPTSSST